MIFLFLFTQYSLSADVLIGNAVCTCVEETGFCNAPCRTNTAKKQVFPKCNKSKPFHTSTGLYDWLLKEIFCIRIDHRKESEKKLNNTEPIISLSTNISSDENKTELAYNYETTILNTNNDNYYVPAPFLASSECHYNIRPLQFLVSIDSLRCYYNRSESYKVQDLLDQNITGVKTIHDGTCNLYDYYKSIDYLIIYDKTNESQPFPTELHLHCESHTDISREMLPLQIGVHFYDQDYSSTTIKETMKSGEAGYSYGQPLIVLRDSSSWPEPFPIPLGYDCSNKSGISYTPLAFGYDTVSGCSEGGKNKTHITDILKRYNRISKMGKANGNYNLDWIDISGMDVIDNCSNLVLTINYEYVGNVQNPQNRIYNASYKCNSPNDNEYFLFLINYLRTSDESSKPFIPKPKGLPDDTFAPII